MKAILFDFDYTLGDSTKGIISSVNFALNKLGYQKRDEETIRKTIGLSLRDTFFELEPEISGCSRNLAGNKKGWIPNRYCNNKISLSN